MRTANADSLTDDVYARLRSDIISCRIPPGTKLNLSKCRAELGVSLGVLREALVRLAAEGFVTTQTQRGFRVPLISAQDLVDLTEARIEIECLCLRRAIAEGDLDWESRIVTAHYRLARLPRRTECQPLGLSDEWSAEHAAFHSSLVDGGKNGWLLRMRDMLFAQSRRFRQLSAAVDDAKRDANEEHRRLMEAVLRRDADAACEEMRRHLTLTTEILLQSGICGLHHDGDDEAANPTPERPTAAGLSSSPRI